MLKSYIGHYYCSSVREINTAPIKAIKRIIEATSNGSKNFFCKIAMPICSTVLSDELTTSDKTFHGVSKVSKDSTTKRAEETMIPPNICHLLTSMLIF